MTSLKIKENWHLILLILLIIIGVSLRFYHLDYIPFWLDEASTLDTASRSLLGIWNIVSTWDSNPPLFYYIEHFMLVFGRSEVVLRFIPALLGVLTIPVFYYIGKEFADEDIGIVMAALLTFSPFHIYYSQEARAYSPMLFFFSLALFFFLLSLRTNSAHSWILFGLFSALTLWTHYYILIPVALLFAFALFWGIARTRKGLTQPHRYALSFVTFLIISLPLVPLIIHLVLTRRNSLLGWGLKGLDLIYAIFINLSEKNLYMLALFCVLFVIGTFFFWKTDKVKTILIAGLLALPIIISIYLSERIPLDPRYLLYLLPVFFLGISLSIKPLARLVKSKDITLVVIILFFLIQAPFLAMEYNSYFTTYSNGDWRGMAHSIEENSIEGDYIIVIPGYGRLPLDIYYSSESDGTYEYSAQNVSQIEQILLRLKNNQAYFVVPGNIKNLGGSTIQWFHNNTQLIGKYHGIELYSLKLSRHSTFSQQQ